MIGARRALAHKMRTHWINFIRDGDPGPEWPRFDPVGQNTMLFNLDSRVVADPDRQKRLAWNGADIIPRRFAS